MTEKLTATQNQCHVIETTNKIGDSSPRRNPGTIEQMIHPTSVHQESLEPPRDHPPASAHGSVAQLELDFAAVPQRLK